MFVNYLANAPPIFIYCKCDRRRRGFLCLLIFFLKKNGLNQARDLAFVLAVWYRNVACHLAVDISDVAVWLVRLPSVSLANQQINPFSSQPHSSATGAFLPLHQSLSHSSHREKGKGRNDGAESYDLSELP